MRLVTPKERNELFALKIQVNITLMEVKQVKHTINELTAIEECTHPICVHKRARARTRTASIPDTCSRSAPLRKNKSCCYSIS